MNYKIECEEKQVDKSNALHFETERTLLREYQKIHNNQKDEIAKWAVHKIRTDKKDETVVPTIPFIGKRYFEQDKRILVYASAENLANYCYGEISDRPWLDDDEKAGNRHRLCFDNQEAQTKVIPYVHCGPMDTGLLLTAVMYLVWKLNISDISNISPREFCETICFGNYGKYSIETKEQERKRKGNDKKRLNKNIDYAGNIDLMSASHSFIETDIKELKPDYIILPATMYNSAKKFIDSIKGTAKIIPIMQMLASNVNNHIAPNKKRINKYKCYTVEELHPTIQNVYREMTDVSLNNYLYVFGYLDTVLSTINDK